jgi:hypothetical protein
MIRSALLFWSLPVVAAFAAPGDYHSTTRYGVYANSLDSLLFEPVIAAVALDAETTELDGRKRLSFHFTLHNPSAAYFEEPAVFLNPFPDFPWTVEMVTPAGLAAELPPGTAGAPGIAATATPLTFRIAASDAEAAKAAILARRHLHLSAWDLYRFDAPIHAADEPMQNAFLDRTLTNNLTTLRFSGASSSLNALTPGSYLVHNPAVFELRAPAFDGEPVLRAYLTNVAMANAEAKTNARRTMILKISSVATDSTTGEVTVTGIEVAMVDNVVSAYSKATHLDGFIGPLPRDPYNPPIGTSFFTFEELERRRSSLEAILAAHGNADYPPGIVADLRGLFNLHYPINEVEFAPGARLDGELLFKGMSFQFDGTERNNQRNQWAYKLTNRFEFTLRLTVEENVDLVDLEKTLLNVPLPGIVVPVFQVPVTVTPRIRFKVGAAVSVGSKIQVPIQGAIDAGFRMAYDGSKPPGSEFRFEPFSEPVPMPLSKPSIGRLLEMDAEAWAELSLDLLLNETIGPGIAVRVTGDLNIRPLANPWWTLDGNLDLKGRFSFNLFGFPLLSTEAPASRLAGVFRKVADGAAPPGGSTGPSDRAEGGHIRWARGIDWEGSFPSDGSACRVRGTAEDVYVAVVDFFQSTTLMRINGRGDLVWIRTIGSLLPFVVETPDGGVILGGGPNGGSGIRLLKYDGSGTLLWDREHLFDTSGGSAPLLYAARLLARDTGPASQELHLVGTSAEGPFVYRCNGAGDVLEVKVYESADYIEVGDAAYTPDGGLVWCGAGQRTGDLKTSGWLMKTDPLGNHSWSNLTETLRGNRFTGVTTGPDGHIYTCGVLGLVYGTQYGSMQLTKHAADGDLIAAVTLSESTDLGTVTDYALYPNHEDPAVGLITNPKSPNGTAFPNWLPDSGNTVWDEGRRIVWTPGGLLVASTTGLASSRAATVGCLTEDFAVRWFTAHEVASSDESISDLLLTEDGILAVGTSANILPALTRSSGGGLSTFLLKLPWEGKCDLHGGTTAIHRYLQPGIHDHRNNEEEAGPYQPSFSGQVDLACTVASKTITAGAPLFPHQFLTTSVTHWEPLEEGDLGRPLTYTEWADYWQLPANSAHLDSDDDLRSNGQEWFFGGNPASVEPGPPDLSLSLTANGSLAFTFTRTRVASLQTPVLQTSTDLSEWVDIPLPATTVSPLNFHLDRVSFPLPAPYDARTFYRINAP